MLANIDTKCTNTILKLICKKILLWIKILFSWEVTAMESLLKIDKALMMKQAESKREIN